ncbi:MULTISPECIES: response regulator transcription factor [unclassified Streptomyces]|uniref:response regulator transcription factor n=1 Tax=unclassified Streptomyces TaxID=2593676 RepID=UPI0022B6BAA2|nr:MULTISPECIES: response regulator transcription factor [unclassified Streptomyces]MCZ7414361.1 response regulator transcription factor [Streptomyces sp. WMMC897]MCZ7431316.1 response regulator transcription factor [Streptomyces sp. WMMC1477]
MKALLVEDDPDVAEALAEGLRLHGWEVARVATGAAALATRPGCDIVLLDLNLPDMDGLEVCRQVRARLRVPIIAVTARSDELDKVLCLRLGADDYVVKPYRLQELLARMTAVLRRLRDAAPPAPEPPGGAEPPPEPGTAAQPGEEHRLVRGALTIDLWRREVRLTDRTVPLTRKEFDLLTLLARAPGRVFSRAHILEHVWGDQWPGTSRTLDAHVSALRRKLGAGGWLRTLRGVGFSFEVLSGEDLPCG